MEASPAENLQGQLATFQKLLAAYDALSAKKTESENQLADLSRSGDLDDGAVLAKISQLREFVNLYPDRISNAATAFNSQVDVLRAACQQFIWQVLMPGQEELENRVRDLVRAALGKYISDEIALKAAVEKSTLMSELNQIKSAVGAKFQIGQFASLLDAEGLISHAKSLPAISQSQASFASKLPAQP